MAIPTITAVKQLYKDAIDAIEIGKTFAIRDYILYLIYANTYGGGFPVGENTVSSWVTADTGALLQTAINDVITISTNKVHSIVPYTGNDGVSGVFIIFITV